MTTQPATFRDLVTGGTLPQYLLICMGIWLFAADSMVTITIMPSVGRALSGYEWFGWATAGYLLGSVIAGASAGLLALRIGLQRATAAAALTYAAGCALSAWAPDMGVFLAGRLLQGVGGGWIVGFCMVAIGLLFPDRLLPKVYATTSSIWGVATLVGPMIGGLFADSGAGGWRWVFWLFAFQAVLVAFAAFRLLPTERGNARIGIAWAQLGLITAAVAAIGLADRVGDAPRMIALTAAAIACLLAAVMVDARAEARLLPRGANDPRTIPGAGFSAMFLLSAASMGFALYAAAILQTLNGFSALLAGYIIAGQALAWSIASLSVSRLTGAWRGTVIRIGAVCIASAVALGAASLRSGSPAGVFFTGVLMGVGFGLSWSFVNQRLLMSMEKEERARAAAGMATVRSTGSAVGAAGAAAVANLAGLSLGLTPATASAAGLWVSLAMTPLAFLGLWPMWRLSALYPPAPAETPSAAAARVDDQAA
ncbi:MAG: MFS transporter [Hyphomonadaceae bacterium]